jgi:hypothetical protein
MSKLISIEEERERWEKKMIQKGPFKWRHLHY